MITKTTNGPETGIAIYVVGKLSEITYMVLSIMKWRFIGFFLEGSKITNKKIFSHQVQKLEVLKEMQPYLLLWNSEQRLTANNGVASRM